MNAKTPIIELKKSEGTYVVSAGNLYRIIAEGKDTDNRFSLMETVLKPGQGAPYHTHTREDEAFFILEGEVTFYLPDKSITANKEDFISCPPGATRGFHNNTNKVARMLLFYSSAGVEEMTVRDGQVVEPGVKASELNSGRDIQCPTLAEEYGIADSETKLPSLYEHISTKKGNLNV